MEIAIFVYLSGIIGAISAFFHGLGTFTLAGTVLYLVFNLLNRGEYAQKYKEDVYNAAGVNLKSARWKIWGFVGVGFIFLATALPSQKTMYLMAGGYFGQQVLQSETTDKVVKIVNSKLDEYLEEAEKTLKK